MNGLAEYPRIIPCAIYAPSRDISQIAIITNNVPGALAEIAFKMAEYGVNVLSGLIMAEPGTEVGTVIMFIDLTDASITLERLLDELRKLDVVLKADVVVRKIGQMAVDGTTHTTTFLGRRVVILDVDDVGSMFKWLVETFSSGGRAILFDMGERAGASAAERLKNLYGLSGRELFETFLALHAAAGWFNYELIEYNEDTVRLRLYENFECMPMAGKLDRPTSHLVRGAIAGVLHRAQGREFDVVEVKCLAKGDAWCEFLATRKEAASQPGFKPGTSSA